MSRRSSSGSRFEVLKVEGEDSDSDEVFYTPPQTPDVLRRRQIQGSGTTVMRKLRSSSYETPPTGQPIEDSLEFKWNHFGERQDYSGVPSLTNLFDVEPQKDINSNSIETDVQILSSIGFHIDYPLGKLGRGGYGVVYRGFYGTGASGHRGSMFAAKIVDFGTKSDEDTLIIREKYETEKYILTNANHPNIVAVRMIINMGDLHTFSFLDIPEVKYISPSRIYLIMDMAEGGQLMGWLYKNKDKADLLLKIGFIRHLFGGMKYLHDRYIVHGDIHPGNVLIFKEGEEFVAKWSDFGDSFVGTNRQYRFRSPKAFHNNHMKVDMSDVSTIMFMILTFTTEDQPLPPESPQEVRLTNEATKMIDKMSGGRNQANSLREIHTEFKHILEDEIILRQTVYTYSIQ